MIIAHERGDTRRNAVTNARRTRRRGPRGVHIRVFSASVSHSVLDSSRPINQSRPPAKYRNLNVNLKQNALTVKRSSGAAGVQIVSPDCYPSILISPSPPPARAATGFPRPASVLRHADIYNSNTVSLESAHRPAECVCGRACISLYTQTGTFK